MKESTSLTSVKEFHELFDLPVLDHPAIPKDRIALRINLLQEELDELHAALQADDQLETLDALCDIQYVLAGAIHEFGLGSRFSAAFAEVHRSNMSKACKTIEQAQATQRHYDALDQNSEIREKDGQWLVYRIADGKVLKSVDYSPADLKQFVD